MHGAEVLESVVVTRPCPLCGRISRRDPPHHVPLPVRCAACSLLFVDPVPPEAITPDAYGADYYEPWQGAEDRPRRAMWRRRLGLLEQHVPGATGGRALLDVGCGDGLFLDLARGAGWNGDGIEFSPEGARRAAARLGRPVAVGNLAASSLLQGPYDVVTLWHVLEHLEHPARMLEAAHRRLRRGGLLAVAVPNLSNLPMRAAYRLARGRALPLYEPGAREPHLSHFSPTTIRTLLSRCGFEPFALVADRCALQAAKRAIDICAAFLSLLTGRLQTDAMAAFARRS
jgi:SAM-dependent methyltransferase